MSGKMDKKKGVLVVGSANVDMVVKTDHFPAPGETILGGNFQMFSGGKGANQAVASAKLNTKTYFIGKMGNDMFREKLTSEMSKDGVELEDLIIDNKLSTGIALITVDTKGENSIVVASGSNMNLTGDDVAKHKSVFKKVNVVLTQLEIPMDTVIKTAELSAGNGCLFILNPAPAKDLPEKLLKLTNYITPNKGELELLTSSRITSFGEIQNAAMRLIDKGVGNVIVTLGEKGVLYVTEDKIKHIEGNKVEVIDTTGAGDAFNGALASALSEGMEIEEALRFANKAASISVTRMGAQSSMPGFEELKALIS